MDKQTPRVLDSGKREEFSTGSKRDTRDGKGRFDLIPRLPLLRAGRSGDFPGDDPAAFAAKMALRAIGPRNALTVSAMASSINSGMIYVAGSFPKADITFIDLNTQADTLLALAPEGILALAQVYEQGAEKYGDRNWEKGQPISRMCDSALRHSFKALAGWTDEPHPAQAAWNWLAVLYTEFYHPEMNDLPWARKEQ